MRVIVTPRARATTTGISSPRGNFRIQHMRRAYEVVRRRDERAWDRVGGPVKTFDEALVVMEALLASFGDRSLEEERREGREARRLAAKEAPVQTSMFDLRDAPGQGRLFR